MATKRRIFVVLPVTALVIAGCGSSNDNKDKVKASSPPPPATKPSSTSPAGGGQQLQLSADPSGKLKFDKTSLSAKAGKVTVVMKNPSGVPHAVAIEGMGVDKDGKTVGRGGSSTVSVSLKAGKYEFYCPVDGHKAAGMKGELTVR